MTDKARAWLVLAGCFLMSVGANGYLIAPSSITPLFIEQFDITRPQAGYLVSAAILGMILAQIPGGYLMDQYDNRWLILAASACYLLVIIAQQNVATFESLLGSRIIAGLFGGFIFTLGANIVGDAVPPERLGLATGVYIASPSVSWAIAHATSPLIGPAYGALRVFLLHGGFTAAGAIVFWLAVSGPIRSDSAPSIDEYLHAVRNPAVILVGLSGFCSYALYVFLNTWLPTYGTDILSLPLAAAGIATALVPVVGIVARPTGGWLSSYIGNRRRPVLIGGLFVSLLFTAAVSTADTLLQFLLLIGIAAFALQLGTGVYYVLTRELATPGTEGTSLTLMTSISFTGSFSGPIIGGWLITTYSWSVAFVTFASVAVFGIFALLPITEST